MAETILERKSKEVKVLDETTQALLASMEKNDRKHRFWQNIALISLLFLAVLGLGYQDYLAQQSKHHIDCIIKLSETPIPADAKSRYIAINTINDTCQIKFTR